MVQNNDAATSKSRIGRGEARRMLSAVIMLVLSAPLVAGVNGTARAQGTDDTLALIEDRLQNTVADILTRNCIGPGEPRPFTVTFYGLPFTDPHFSQNDRERINQTVLTGLREARRVSIDVSAAENAGALAPISGQDASDRTALANALSRLGSSTLPIVLKATRPEPNIARLDMAVFARGAEGAYGCNRSITFNLDLGTLEPVRDSRGFRDYVTLDGAYGMALDSLAPRLKGVTGIWLDTQTDNSCPYISRAVSRFEDAYYGNGQVNFSAGLTDRNLPDFLLEEPGEGDGAATLALKYSVPEGVENTLDLLVSLTAKGRVLSRQRFSVAAETQDLDACRPAPATADATPVDGGEVPPTDPQNAADTGQAGDGADRVASTGNPDEPGGAPDVARDGTVNSVPQPIDDPDATEPGEDLATLDQSSAPACQERGEILDFTVGPRIARTGDRLSLRGLVRQCQPVFFAYASGKVTPVPLRIFELGSQPSGAISYESSPETKIKLYLEEQDPVGLNKIVLFCSSCVVNPAQSDLVEWLRGVRDRLASDQRSGAATLPNGVGYAFGSVEKVN
ncbi:hypothetical protein [Jiella marina]|uniref:hypothetical protein n=1 Tax=Jiella sp. LLJ827 TaxID=2917712 RepID=UPI00210076CD|nr:hypothetical protein [Jiella sp. LLJ827]MCQ0989165.1 hypothetical protein [Jiella sp. LLJ827]